MVIPVYVKHIATVLLWALCEFLSARQINDKSPVPEDEFLPRKRRKLSFIFFFLPKNQPVRWRAYWMHRLVQFCFCIDIVIMVIWRCVSGSFDFLYRRVFVLFPIYMVSLDMALQIGTFCYVKIKQLISKKKYNRTGDGLREPS